MNPEIKKYSKRTLLVTISLLMLLSPFYAAPNSMAASAQSGPRYGGTLRIAYSADPISFNPIPQFWSTGMYLYVNVYAKAYIFDDLYNPTGYAAEGEPLHTSTDEYPSIWTITLKDDVMWQDGTPMTSADIEFTYGMHAWGAQADPLHMEYDEYLEIAMYHSTTYFEDLAKIETPDDKTTVMYFNEVNLGAFLIEMNMNIILPKHLWGDFNRNNPSGMKMEDNQYNTKPIGAGAYQVTEYEIDQYIIMDRFEDFHDGYPYLDHLVWQIIDSNVAAMLALENGEIDHVHEFTNFPLSEIARVNSYPDFTVLAFPYTTTWRVTMNMHEDALARWPWLDDVDVRYAMEYAIDKQTIIDNVAFGNTHVVDTAVSWIVAPYGGDYNTVDQGYTGDWAIEPRDYDPVKAAQLLDDAGWVLNGDGVRQKGSVKMEGVEMPYYEDFVGLAEAIPAYWAELGIFIDPLPIEHNSFFDGIEASEKGLEQPDFGGGPYPLGLNTMGGGPDPAQVIGWITTRNEYVGSWDTGGDNFGFYSNERVDELFKLGGGAESYEIRKEYYDEMQYLVHKDAGFLMLWNKWKVDAFNNNFAGFGSNRPIAWYGRYFRGEDGSSNIDKGVYWRGGTVNPGGDVITETSIVTDITTATTVTTVPEFMNMLAAFAIVLYTGVFVYRRRRRN